MAVVSSREVTLKMRSRLRANSTILRFFRFNRGALRPEIAIFWPRKHASVRSKRQLNARCEAAAGAIDEGDVAAMTARD